MAASRPARGRAELAATRRQIFDHLEWARAYFARRARPLRAAGAARGNSHLMAIGGPAKKCARPDAADPANWTAGLLPGRPAGRVPLERKPQKCRACLCAERIAGG